VGTNSTVAFSAVTCSKYSTTGTSDVYVGTQAGLLYKILNAGDIPQAEEIGSTNFPTGNISCIAEGDSENELLVTFSNYGVSSVWLTLDGGVTWQEKEVNLPDMPIRWALFHPENHGQVMLATELGIWATNTLLEAETEWAPANAGMGNVRVDMLKLRTADNVVLAASHGRGLFTCTYTRDIYTSVDELPANYLSLTLYPNPAGTSVTIQWNSFSQAEATVFVTDLSGKTVEQKTVSVQNDQAITLDVSHYQKGTYVVGVRQAKEVYTEKLVVN
jgi:hypothetical protein